MRSIISCGLSDYGAAPPRRKRSFPGRAAL